MENLLRYDDCITTYTGKKFNLIEPEASMVDILDISHGLAYKGHFGGQTPKFFSIAQHSLLVVDLLPHRWRVGKPELAMVALLHDAAEAYIGDMVKPLKVHLPKFKEVENKIMEVIFEKFQLRGEYLKSIKKYDIEAQEVEYQTFFRKANTLQYLMPDEAQQAFMCRYWHLKSLIDGNELENKTISASEVNQIIK